MSKIKKLFKKPKPAPKAVIVPQADTEALDKLRRRRMTGGTRSRQDTIGMSDDEDTLS